jgi:hypothetical protein
MFTIPSTHLVIISYSDPGKRIERFLKDKNKAQYTLLIGPHFGDLRKLVENYLPKSAIDRLTIKMNELKSKRDGKVQESAVDKAGQSTNVQGGQNKISTDESPF